jgi:hypothetical protein
MKIDFSKIFGVAFFFVAQDPDSQVDGDENSNNF